jgi:hypothetical protein
LRTHVTVTSGWPGCSSTSSEVGPRSAHTRSKPSRGGTSNFNGWAEPAGSRAPADQEGRTG